MIKGFVYVLSNREDGNWYIGSHEGTTDDGYIASGIRIKNAIDKYGIENFDRYIIYRGENFREQEEIYLTILDAASNPKSYNLKNKAFGGKIYDIPPMLGKKHTEETKKKMSLSGKGRQFSDAHKRKIGNFHRGKIVSEITREKLRKYNKDKKLSEETKRKIGEASRKHWQNNSELKERWKTRMPRGKNGRFLAKEKTN
ncbi:hypothetical protein CL634_08460 [bacterium]|nr:hypothetical protein [bacterium]